MTSIRSCVWGRTPRSSGCTSSSWWPRRCGEPECCSPCPRRPPRTWRRSSGPPGPAWLSSRLSSKTSSGRRRPPTPRASGNTTGCPSASGCTWPTSIPTRTTSGCSKPIAAWPARGRPGLLFFGETTRGPRPRSRSASRSSVSTRMSSSCRGSKPPTCLFSIRPRRPSFFLRSMREAGCRWSRPWPAACPWPLRGSLPSWNSRATPRSDSTRPTSPRSRRPCASSRATPASASVKRREGLDRAGDFRAEAVIPRLLDAYARAAATR